MKRIAMHFASVLTAIGLLCISAYASTVTRSIPSVRLTIKNGGIEFGSQLEDTPEGYITVPDNQYYTLDSAEWIDDISKIKPGATPMIRVRLEAIPKEVSHTNYDQIYLFRGAYTGSNVSITRGTLKNAEVKDSGYYLELTVQMSSIKGTFDMPQTADWSSPVGTAVWSTSDIDSGVHELICYRGSTAIKKLNNYKGTSYNFFPYMTKEGAYKYRIRTVADPSVKVGNSSEWLESGELYISTSEVSDGSGQTSSDENGAGQSIPFVNDSAYPEGTGSTVTIGWMEQNGAKYFMYPDGNLAKSGWMKLDGSWYMFDDEGRMLTGWNKNKYGKWFYMDTATGIMKTGWIKDNGKWYFLETTEGDIEGCMRTGWLNWNDNVYYLNDSGVMVTGWYKVDGNYRYFYPEGSTDGKLGAMARNTTTAGFHFDENGIWK